MATIFDAMQGQNQGQMLALAWNNTAGLTNITSLVGTDGKKFLPVKDRGFYLPGVIRSLPTGGILYSGLPVVDFVHSWISDGQIERLMTYRGNVTIRHHISESVGRLDIQTSNAIYNMDLNQLAQLTRRQDGYEGFVSRFVIVEVI